jgi:hypothetical protein
MSIQHNIARLYFDYSPMNDYGFADNGGHAKDCTRGPLTWEVTRHIEYAYGDEDGHVRGTSLRLCCPECGAVQFHGTDAEHGLELARRYTTTAQLGFGAAPVRLAGLWLWPGPVASYGNEKLGPESYFATTTDVRPSSPDMVAGSLGWSRNYARVNGAVRWHAGLGCHKWGGIITAAPSHFTSRTAAAKWLAAELAK